MKQIFSKRKKQITKIQDKKITRAKKVISETNQDLKETHDKENQSNRKIKYNQKYSDNKNHQHE